MDIVSRNNDLSPYKISLCILLHQALTNPVMAASVKPALLSFIINEIHQVRPTELTLNELMSELRKIDASSTAQNAMTGEGITELFEKDLKLLEEFTDLLTLFNTRLSELKSDGELNLGYLEEGSVLYLFLRKCFLSFARMDFQGLFDLFENLKKFREGQKLTKLPESETKMYLSQLASMLPNLVTQNTKEQIYSHISTLPIPQTYILRAHIEAYYGNDISIDYLHKYFDLILDKQMPTKTSREKGLVAVRSSTHLASLHRVKIELELGHLEAAVHLLVETVKRALSENDNSVILESTLLFLKIAEIMGNSSQQKRLAEKAVMHALKLGNVKALIVSSLCFAQLHNFYPSICSPMIIQAIKPVEDIKKKQGVLQEKNFKLDPDSPAWVNLSSYTLIESLLSFNYKDYSSKLLQIKALNWFTNGNSDLCNIFAKTLTAQFPNCFKSRNDIGFYFNLAKEKALNSKDETISLLEQIDYENPVKDCIDWNFTLSQILHTWCLFSGQLLEAEFLEKEMMKSMGHNSPFEFKIEVIYKKAQRLIFEGEYEQAMEDLNSIIADMKERGMKFKTIEMSLLISEIYSATDQAFQALFTVLELLPMIESRKCMEFPVKIRLADILLEALPSAIKSMQILTEIRKNLHQCSNNYTLGKYFKTLAKAKIQLSYSLQDAIMKKHFLIQAVHDLNKANTHFKPIHCLTEMRECYYLLSRTFHDLSDTKNRDKASECFCKTHQEISDGAFQDSLQKQGPRIENWQAPSIYLEIITPGNEC